MAGPEWFLVELKVADWPRAAAWYEGVLGLRPTLRDEPRQYLLLDAGPGRVALKGGGDPAAPRDAARLFFRVGDVEAERARLAAAGVEASAVRVDAEEGYREIRLVDPDGTPIRLFDLRRPPA